MGAEERQKPHVDPSAVHDLNQLLGIRDQDCLDRELLSQFRDHPREEILESFPDLLVVFLHPVTTEASEGVGAQRTSVSSDELRSKKFVEMDSFRLLEHDCIPENWDLKTHEVFCSLVRELVRSWSPAADHLSTFRHREPFSRFHPKNPRHGLLPMSLRQTEAEGMCLRINWWIGVEKEKRMALRRGGKGRMECNREREKMSNRKKDENPKEEGMSPGMHGWLL